ncbi:homoserine kinase [Haloechinothrix salitolerans]|uniref:Homoserine kinase n=1 Tax=Haloechinothrix salitolerans TaxID=926830 RepID=A0ABW2C7I0_9PSEU
MSTSGDSGAAALPPRGVRVRVPASTANLGPGFDTFGMALGRYDHIEVRTLAEPGLTIDVSDAGAGGIEDVPRDESHLVVRVLRRTFDHLGVSAVGLALRCENAIPHARGLGSSAAAVVAGVAAAYALADQPLDTDAVLGIAAEFEGHVDNAAASLLGGAVIAWRDEGEPAAASPAAGHAARGGAAAGWHAERLSPHSEIRPVVAIAEQRSSTDATRGLLPESVPHADAVFSAGRAALAVHALTAAPDLLVAATADRLHQHYRAPAYPATAHLIEALRKSGVAAAVSGAGPTVLALTTDGRVPEDVDTSGFRVVELPIDSAGVTVAQL